MKQRAATTAAPNQDAGRGTPDADSGATRDIRAASGVQRPASPAEPVARFSVRNWEPEADYPLFKSWWAAHGVNAVGMGILPACGLVVLSAGEPILAAWLYQDNSCGVGWLAWLIGRPGCRDVPRALPVLLGAADAVMRSQERHSLIVLTDKRGYGRALVRHGFERAHSATEYWRVLPTERSAA